jgi:hypothetical protein
LLEGEGMRLASLVGVAAIAAFAACGGRTEGIALSDVPVDAGADRAIAPPAPTAIADAQAPAVSCDAVLCPGPIAWRFDGGDVAFVESSALTACTQYTHSQSPTTTTPKGLACQQSIATCGRDGVDARAVLLAMDAPDVVAAFTSGPSLYGHDDRPADGAVFQIDAFGTRIEIGSSCGGNSSGCTDAPSGVVALVQLLQRLDQEQTHVGECAQVFHGK